MLRGLSRSQYDVLVLCPEEGELQQMVRAEGVETASIPEMQARFTLRPDRLLRYASSVASAVMRLRREIKRVDPDLVHAQHRARRNRDDNRNGGYREDRGLACARYPAKNIHSVT